MRRVSTPQGVSRYHVRIWDRYKRPVASLAVLTDAQASWRPGRYNTDFWDCSVRFRFPVIKLLDWRKRRAELEQSDNPFATIVLAHLAAQETGRNVRRRQTAKLALIRRLYERGYDREQALSLLRFIDWLVVLPPELEQQVLQEIEAIEEEDALYH